MVLLPLWKLGLTPEMVKKAEMELGETPEVKRKAVQEMKSLIEGKEGFHPVTDEEFLVRFLRANKYDVHRTFKTFENYYSFKAQFSGQLTDLPLESFRKLLETANIYIPHLRNHNGEAVLIAHMGAFDYDEWTAENLLAVGIAIAEVCMETDACQRCLPLRIKSINIVNEASPFAYIYYITKPLLKKKIFERVHFHGKKLDGLKTHFAPEILPECLGGTLKSVDIEEFRSILFQNSALLERLNSYVYKNKKYPLCNYGNERNTASLENCSTNSLFVGT